MIRSTVKAPGTAQGLAPQTAPYFVIRQVPTFPSSSSSQNDPDDNNNDPNSFNGSHSSGSNGLSKSILEYIFIAVVIAIIFCFILRRYRIHRLKNQRRAFLPTASPLQILRPTGQPYPPYPEPHLRGIPAAYMGQNRRSRRTRAPDIDSSGRRLGDLPVEVDHDGELGAKDDLPAYDNYGGPPKYFELDLHNRNLPPPGSTVHTPDVDLENTDNTFSENITPPSVGMTRVNHLANDTSRPIPPPSFEDSSASTTRRET